MAETSSNVTIQDIPEWKKAYWQALMNAGSGLVFTPEYMQQQGIPVSSGYTPQAPPQTYVPPGQPPMTDIEPAPYSYTQSRSGGQGGSALARGAAGIEEALRANRIQFASGGVIRAAGGTRLSESADAIEALLAQGAAPAGSDVWLGPGGTPLGGTYPGMNVSPTPNVPTHIGTSTQAPPPPVPPAVTPPAFAGPNGVISTPPSGTLTPGNPNPTPPTHVGSGGGQPPANPSLPGGGGGGAPQVATPMFVGAKPANFAGAAQAANAGYNPAQYADDSVAQDLAKKMGAQVAYTNTGGPIGPPSQATLYSGGEAFNNAGLVNQINEKFKTEGDVGMRDARLNAIRDEIRSLGGTPGFKKGGTVRAAAGMFTGTGTDAYSMQNPATGSQFFGGGTQPPATATATLPSAPPAAGPINPFTAAPSTPLAAAAPTSTNWTGGAVGTRLPSVAPAGGAMQSSAPGTDKAPGYDYWNTKEWQDANYHDNSQDTMHALDGSPHSAATGTATLPSGAPAPPSFDALQPYLKYKGPRVLSNGAGFGEVGPNGTPQVSDLTRNSLSGYNSIPSAFDSAGNIVTNRTETGEATTNYGSASDTFNTAGQLALDASRRAGDASYNSPLTSSFANTMNGIRTDPSRFQAGDISLGQLTASQLDAPMGVSPSQLTSYQMEGPRLLDMSQSGIDPTYIAGQDVQRINAPTNNVKDVQGGQIGVGTFLDPGVAQSYMSPYQRQVNDVRRRDADLAYNEQKAARQAAAVRAGAFGGSRQAVADSLAERDMLNQKDRITAEGQQGAFENAQAQFERDRAARMTGDTFNVDSKFKGDVTNQSKDMSVGLANLQSWLQSQNLGATLGQQANLANQNAYMDAATKNQGVNLQAELANQGVLQDANKTNLGAALGVQELGANQALDASKTNQAAGLQAGLANLQAAQQTQALARNSGLDAAKSNQGTRLTQNQALLDAAAREDQLKQQADQGNFTNQLNAMGQETNSALAANTIGQSRADLQRLMQATELQKLQQQGAAGAGIDSRTQSNLDMNYQDFINQRNYPYQQLNWLQGLYSGVPQGFNQEQVLFNRTNPAAQYGGLATAGLGALSSALGKKKGGLVRMKKVIDMKKQRDGAWKAA